MDFERKLYRKLFNKEMLPVERDAIKRRYEAYDADNNGSIGYKEFCMYHAGRLLGKRPKVCLLFSLKYEGFLWDFRNLCVSCVF